MSKQVSYPEFDKYYYYHASVQSPETDVEFLERVYKEARHEIPEIFTMTEDFCGTFAISCEWAKLGDNYKAIGIDLDQEPISYGREHYFTELDEEEKSRLTILNKNVLDKELPKTDLICGLNFSYFIFKQRSTLKEYFQNAYDRLNEDGVFVLDCFGGSKCYEANEEETEYTDDKFSYFWDQDSFDPITNEAQFYIHFKRKGEKKRTNQFSYDWRMWSIPEIRDVLEEVGFKKIDIYWEGTTDDGEGDGHFSKTNVGEECESWICYIVGSK